MIDVLSYFVSWQFVESLFIIIILGFFLKAINRYLIKREKTNPKSERKKSTTIGIVLSTLRYIAVLSAVFIILSINGIDPAGIFAVFLIKGEVEPDYIVSRKIGSRYYKSCFCTIVFM